MSTRRRDVSPLMLRNQLLSRIPLASRVSLGPAWFVVAVIMLMSASFAPDAAADDPTSTAPAVEPTPVTLSARNLDIQDILTMLANSRGLNIISGSEVRGTVSLELRDVPFNQALRAIVAMAGYEVNRKGNIYFVRLPVGVDPRESLMRTVQTFRLNYAKPEEILPVVQAGLSPEGQATSYSPIRAIVVEDKPSVLEHIASVVSSLDRPPRQVLIEAQVLEARLSSDVRFGIDWSLVFSTHEGSGDVVVDGFASPGGLGAEGVFVSWGEGDFLSSLEMMQGIDDLQSLASPQVLTVDGQKAEIIIGGQLGFPVVTTVENTVIQSVEFLDVGTQLVLTPTITEDGFVLMEIHPELSDGKVEAGLPSKTTTEVTTKVLVKDGQTIFVGGLIRDRNETTRNGIPLLMSIPLLGHLFGKTTHSVEKSEIIALITPHIVEAGAEVAYRQAGYVEQ